MGKAEKSFEKSAETRMQGSEENGLSAEAEKGKAALVDRQRMYTEGLKAGDRSGITDEFGKPVLVAEAPVPSGKSILDNAEELAKDPHRWESQTTGKCNQFVEAALQDAGIALPWKVGQADCHAMREALDKECAKPNSHWEKVYLYDSKHPLQSDERFTHYEPKDGDLIIWDKVWGDKWVQHSGIAAEPYDMIYAGARDPKKHGVGKTDISNFTQHAPYGAPTAVYRCKK